MMPVFIDSIVERSIHCSLAKAAIKYNPHACTYIRFMGIYGKEPPQKRYQGRYLAIEY